MFPNFILKILFHFVNAIITSNKINHLIDSNRQIQISGVVFDRRTIQIQIQIQSFPNIRSGIKKNGEKSSKKKLMHIRMEIWMLAPEVPFDLEETSD